MEMNDLLHAAVDSGASDILLATGAPPMFRISGDLQPANLGAFTAPALEELCKQVLTPEQVESYLDYMKKLIEEFVEETDSRWGQFVLEDFLDLVGRFWLVKPKASDLESLLDALLEAA